MRSISYLVQYAGAAGAVAAVCTACDTTPPDASSVTVVDSAGVQIVETRAPLWQEGDAWRISEAPVLQIGTAQGDADYELFRVAGVVRLTDGRIVVANDGSSQLRYYDANGAHLLDVGGKGDGPGEFQFLSGIWTSGADSVVAFDNMHRRVSVFDAQGRFVRSVQLEVVDGAGRPSAQTGFDDGSILAASSAGSLSRQEGRIEGSTWVHGRFSKDGAFLNKIGEGRGGPRWGTDYRGRFSFPYLPLVIGLPPAGADRSSLYHGSGDRFEIERRSTDGSLQRIMRWHAERRPVSADVVAQYKSYLAGTADSPEGRRQAEACVDAVPFPEFMPAYQSVKIDLLSNVWVEQYRAPWEEQPRWWVFDAEGRWLGELFTPSNFRVDEIGADYLLGVRRDEDRVEYVAMLALTRDDR